MPSFRSSVFALAFSVVLLSALLAAQFAPLPAQGRDPAIQQATERRIPVGTSTIAGIVVTADTGRPVRGARVTVSGQIVSTVPIGISGRGGVQGGIPTGGAPLPGAARGNVNVNVQMPSGVSRTVFTDADGQFSFPRLPTGQFTLSVSENHFLPLNYGQKRFGGQGSLIPLAEGQKLTLKVPMVRGAVITGVVVGPDGEPQDNAQVRGWRYAMNNGFRRLQSVGFAQTDDRGVYRMFGLQPGDYVVSATPNANELFNFERNATQFDLVERAIASGQVIPPAGPGLPPTVSVPVAPQPAPGQMMTAPSYLATYAPSSLVPSGAATVTLSGGEERTGVEIRVRLTQASTIQGTVLTPLDPGVTVQLSLVSDDVTVDAPQANSARPDNFGKFMFRTVSPGKYTVFAQTVAAPAPMVVVYGQPSQPQPQPVLTDAQKMWGKAQVTVAGESTVEVSVSLEPSRSISGVVVFEMTRPPDLSRARFMVSVNPAPSPQQVFFGQTPQAQVGPDGRFTITGVAPGRYTIRVSGGQMKSSIVAGQDTLDFPFEFTGDRDVTDAVITLTDSVSELSGTLTDNTGKAAPDFMIVVASTDNRYWIPGARRIVMTRPGADGRYTVRSLPPGTYLVAAVTDLENGAQYDPEFLRSLAGVSVPVMIMEGAKVTQDLRVK